MNQAVHQEKTCNDQPHCRLSSINFPSPTPSFTSIV
jgi:hypothetical protein